MRSWTRRRQLTNGPLPGSDIQRGWTKEAWTSIVWTEHTWNIMLKSIFPEIKLGPGYYAHCDLKWSGKLSNAASLLRDIKNSGLQICVFYTMQSFQEEGKLNRMYCIWYIQEIRFDKFYWNFFRWDLIMMSSQEGDVYSRFKFFLIDGSLEAFNM